MPEAYLQELYLKTEQSLIDEIFRKRAKGYVDYAEVAALERVQATLQGMIDEGFEYVPKMIEKRFYGGSGASGGYANAKGLNAVQTAVEEQLIDALLANVMSAAEKAYETSRTLYRLARLDDDELRKAALVSTAYAEALGKGAYTSAQLMEVSIRNHGITAFVDKAGRNWSLASYCSMATRTTARQAQVAALLTKDDHDLFRIVPHASSCPICAPLEGRVYSKSGADPNYPPLSLAFGKIDPAGSDDLSNTYLNIHPNCLCTLVRYTEMGKTDKEIEAVRQFSNPDTNPLDIDPRSKKQVEAYKEKERNRARLLRERRKKEAEKVAEAIPKPAKLKSNFVPAKTIQEAEEHAKRFIDDAQWAALGLSYKGISVDVANAVNKTIGDLFDEFEIEKFGGIVAPAGNTKLGKSVENAVAAYHPARNSFILNRKSLTDESLRQEAEAVSRWLEHPERFDLSGMSRTHVQIMENSKQSGRLVVSRTVEEAMSHEFGHALSRTALKNSPELDELRARMPQYAPRISGYATANFDEYIAESFASWRKGENVADPLMVKVFEEARR